jgi:dynein heavy chain
VEYDAVVKYVAPKRQRLAAAQAEYSALASSLRSKRSELDRVQRRLVELADKLRCVSDGAAQR